jgi:hypothetical protein
MICPTTLIDACVFVTSVSFLPSCCLAMIGGYTYRHTKRWEEFMKYATEMGSGAMTYKFHKDCFRHSKLIVGDTQTAW